MKTTYIKYAALLFLLFSILGCNNYLDVVPKGEVVLSTVEEYEALFNSQDCFYYPNTYVKYLSDNEWAHPANIDKANETQTPDIGYIDYAWDDSDPQTRGRVSVLGSMATGNSIFYNNIYQSCYARITRISNIILSSIDDASGDEAKKAQLKAEAKVLRAYNHFYLINTFAKQYDPATAATDMGIYLRMNTDLAYKPSQSTVEETYSAIESDINEAIPDLSNTPQNNLHFSKAAGYALKAKVHLFKKEFAEAKNAALESYKLNHEVMNLITYYNSDTADFTNRYRVDMSEKENLYYASGGNMESSNFPMNQLISKELVDLYNENGNKDVRLLAFFGGKDEGASQLYTEDGYGPLGYIVTPITLFAYNSAGLRTTDVMLILAECYAREGNYTLMKQYLDEVRKNRIISYTQASENPVNWVDAVNIVIKERRKEFPVGSYRWFDMRRLNTEPEFRKEYRRTIPANPNSTYNVQKEYVLEPSSYLYVCPFPLQVLRQSLDLQNNTPEFVDR